MGQLRWVTPVLLCVFLTSAAFAQKKVSPELQLAVAQSNVIEACDKEQSRLDDYLLENNRGDFSRSEILQFLRDTTAVCLDTTSELSKSGSIAEVRAVRSKMRKRFINIIDGWLAKEQAAKEAAQKKS